MEAFSSLQLLNNTFPFRTANQTLNIAATANKRRNLLRTGVITGQLPLLRRIPLTHNVALFPPTCGWRTYSIRCSGGDDIGSFSSDSVAEGSASFTVGMTEVTTRVKDGKYPVLSDMFFGGYDVDSSRTDVDFLSKGPLG